MTMGSLTIPQTRHWSGKQDGVVEIDRTALLFGDVQGMISIFEITSWLHDATVGASAPGDTASSSSKLPASSSSSSNSFDGSDVDEPPCLASWQAHASAVVSSALIPGTKGLLTVGADMTVKFWSLEGVWAKRDTSQHGCSFLWGAMNLCARPPSVIEDETAIKHPWNLPWHLRQSPLFTLQALRVLESIEGKEKVRQIYAALQTSAKNARAKAHQKKMMQRAKTRAELESAAFAQSNIDSEDWRRLPGGRRVKLLEIPKGPVVIEEEDTGQRTPKSLQQDAINAELLQASPNTDHRTAKYSPAVKKLAQKLDKIEHEIERRKRAEEEARLLEASRQAKQAKQSERFQAAAKKVANASRLFSRMQPKARSSNSQEQASPARKSGGPKASSFSKSSPGKSDSAKSILRSPASFTLMEGHRHDSLVNEIPSDPAEHSVTNDGPSLTGSRAFPIPVIPMIAPSHCSASKPQSDKSKVHRLSAHRLHQAQTLNGESSMMSRGFLHSAMDRVDQATSSMARPTSAQSKLSRPASAQSRRPASAQSRAASSISQISSASIEYVGSNASTMSELGLKNVVASTKQDHNNKNLPRTASAPSVGQLPAGRSCRLSSHDVRWGEGETARMMRQTWTKSGSAGSLNSKEFMKLIATL
jgi:hypothetical protein